MRSNVASAVLAAAFVLAPAIAGYAPALSQDFSITNKEQAAGDWTRKLQEWWDVHAWYPPDALEKKQAGTVKLHLVIHPDGEIWTMEFVERSGSKSIDDAGFYAFHGGHLLPFPPGTSPPQTDVNLTLHFVLEHRPSKTPFTIGNDPVEETVVDTMLEKTCTGTVTPLWWEFGSKLWVQAIFYHRPDGSKWVKWYQNGLGPEFRRVTELGKSANWTFLHGGGTMGKLPANYWVWPIDDHHVSGSAVNPYGTVALTCE